MMHLIFDIHVLMLNYMDESIDILQNQEHNIILPKIRIKLNKTQTYKLNL